MLGHGDAGRGKARVTSPVTARGPLAPLLPIGSASPAPVQATLGALLADKGLGVTVWSFLEEEAQQLQSERRHPHLPDLAFPEALTFTTSLGATLAGADAVTLVVPSHAVRETCKSIAGANLTLPRAPFVIASKGIEEDSLCLMSDVVSQELGEVPVAVLSGPSHAQHARAS